jgi:hypothetical protein
VPIIYEATFSMERLHGVPNNWVQCEGIRLESNIAISIIRDICRALKTAGKPDGAIVFYEDGYAEPSYRFPSIYQIVARMEETFAPAVAAAVKPAPSEREPSAASGPALISAAVYLALTQLSSEPHNWSALHGRTRGVLLDRGYVSVDNEVPEITATGQQAMEAYQDAKSTYPDLSSASKADLVEAAATIGLKLNSSLLRTLKFIETTAAERSLEDLEAMAWKVRVPVRLGRCRSEMMKKRRVLATIANAGKLAQAL